MNIFRRLVPGGTPMSRAINGGATFKESPYFGPSVNSIRVIGRVATNVEKMGLNQDKVRFKIVNTNSGKRVLGQSDKLFHDIRVLRPSVVERVIEMVHKGKILSVEGELLYYKFKDGDITVKTPYIKMNSFQILEYDPRTRTYHQGQTPASSRGDASYAANEYGNREFDGQSYDEDRRMFDDDEDMGSFQGGDKEFRRE